MSSAALFLACASALAACAPEANDQNIIIDNNVADADIEAVPADESSVTPSGELANGAVEENAALENNANSL